jgi:RimJ/RimL family protein N-acetyltransferase
VPGVRLVPFDRGHLEGFRSLLGDPDVLRFTRFPLDPPADYPERWLDRYEAGRKAGKSAAFAILADGAFAGIAVAPEIHADARTAELGYLVTPGMRGRGIASEALSLLTDWAFAELEALRLELLISADNEASKRVAQRCGYLREGVLRSVWFKGDLRQDTEIWSRLPATPG